MFERVKYPDGQVGAKLIAASLGHIPKWEVKERINSYEDLFYVRAIADILQNNDMSQSWNLFIPCLFGQRSDRRFGEKQSFDLKLITDVINDCKFNQVQIFDPHSDVSLALIERSVKVSSFEYVEKAINDIIKNQEKEEGELGRLYSPDLLLVSPDAGAYKKVFEYGEKLNYPVMGAMKHRDKDGKIDLMFTHDVEGKDCLIVDDLCSRGGTFLKLAEQLKNQRARKIFLYISHFEGGCEEYEQTIVNLSKSINYIYTTNSFRDFNEKDQKTMTIYKVI